MLPDPRGCREKTTQPHQFLLALQKSLANKFTHLRPAFRKTTWSQRQAERERDQLSMRWVLPLVPETISLTTTHHYLSG
jgi:hypothetical protein